MMMETLLVTLTHLELTVLYGTWQMVQTHIWETLHNGQILMAMDLVIILLQRPMEMIVLPYPELLLRIEMAVLIPIAMVGQILMVYGQLQIMLMLSSMSLHSGAIQMVMGTEIMLQESIQIIAQVLLVPRLKWGIWVVLMLMVMDTLIPMMNSLQTTHNG